MMNVKEKGVDDSENNVITLWAKGPTAGRIPVDGHIWPLTLRQAILPAFRLCRERLEAAGRKTAICQPYGKTGSLCGTVLAGATQHGR